MTPEALDPGFFRRDPVTCARELIGCVFEWDGCSGRIVETEAYTATGDPASHTFFRPSARRFIEDREVGDAYVYLNYGVHWLFNVLVKGGPMDGFVLFRALEPLSGLERMRERRPGCRDQDLCAGPGKLTRALGIDGSHHFEGFLHLEGRGILAKSSEPRIAAGPRIGISRGQEFPWRFMAVDSPSLSRKPEK